MDGYVSLSAECLNFRSTFPIHIQLCSWTPQCGSVSNADVSRVPHVTWFSGNSCRCARASASVTVGTLVCDAIWHGELTLHLWSVQPPDCATIGLVLYRIFLLWDRNAAVRAGIIGGIVVAYAICIPFVFFFAKGLRGAQRYAITVVIEYHLTQLWLCYTYTEHTTFQSLGVYSICFSMVATRKLEGIWWPQVWILRG